LNEHDDVIYFTVLTRAPTTAIWPPGQCASFATDFGKWKSRLEESWEVKSWT